MLKEKIIEILSETTAPLHFYRLFDRLKGDGLKLAEYKQNLKELKAENKILMNRKEFISIYGQSTTTQPVTRNTTSQRKVSNKPAQTSKEVKQTQREPKVIDLNRDYYGKAYDHDGKFQIKISGINRLFNVHNYSLDQELFEGAVVKVKPLPDLCKEKSSFY